VPARTRSLLVAVGVLGAAIVFARPVPSGAGQVHRCGGRDATVVGTPGERLVSGTSHDDVIWVGPGNHEVLGLGGDDVICAGSGEDLIYGGPGNDTVYGGRGHDIIFGGAGNDTVRGGKGSDTIYGGRGDDNLTGGRAGHNLIYGGAGDDQLSGGSGDDNVLHGGLGIDVLRGGGGNGDVLDGGYGWDILDGGSGHDETASFATMPRSERKGGGVWASLQTGRAYGDGDDKLHHIENLEGSVFNDTLIGNRHRNKLYGGPGDDRLVGGGGRDELVGGPGRNRCLGGSRQGRESCGGHPVKGATVDAYFYSGIDPAAAGVVVAGGSRSDNVSVSLDVATATLRITAGRAIAVESPCVHPTSRLREATCPVGPLPRWLTVDLGPGNDHFRVVGSLEGLGEVRVDGGPGNDVIHGGPEEDLLEGGPGSDRLYGGPGDDALVGGPGEGGTDFLYGGAGGDLIAASSACEGGALVGGAGRNDASFAEMGLQPGILVASLAAGRAYVEGVRGCRPIRISGARDLEGTMGSDILIGDAKGNHIIGQGGVDEIFGRGGEDVIDARDGIPDALIQCGTKGHPSGTAQIDSVDPHPLYCDHVEVGKPIPGLPHFHTPSPFGEPKAKPSAPGSAQPDRDS
jgi:Ca2+-binding RTX toxin-like protein